MIEQGALICRCVLCASLQSGAGAPNDAATMVPWAANSMGVSGVLYIDALLAGSSSRWNADATYGTPTSLTFSFMTAPPSTAGSTEWRTFLTFASVQKNGARASLAQFAEVANVTFTEVKDSNAANLRFANCYQNYVSAGYAYYPGQNNGGQVWLAREDANSFNQTVGGYGYMTMLHEIGHAIGLKHPGNYNAGSNRENANTGPFLPTAQDNYAYSLMSYNSVPPNLYASSLMMYDIAALQFLYGANISTRSGNDTYTFATVATQLQCIWDGGGTDTLDCANQTAAVVLNLSAGSFSTVGGVANSVSIAYGVTIENAVGGIRNDILIGNAASNRLEGGPGNDTLNGGDGVDMAVFSGGRSAYTITRSGAVTTVSGPSGTDTLTNVERLTFDDRMVLLNAPSWQSNVNQFSARSGGVEFTVRQEAISEINDPTRGSLRSRVLVNGSEITGVPSTLRRGWRAPLTCDIDGNGKSEIFFFGVEQVAGVGNGYGATWELDASGAVSRSQLQFQMSRQGWEAVGAADVNGIAGDEIIWQSISSGQKAIWTDADRDGTVDGGYVIGGLGSNAQERIVGVSDINANGLREFLICNDTSGRLSAYETTPASAGNATAALLQEFADINAFNAAAASQNFSRTIFSVMT